ncbi:MAG: hypothetical protein OXQ89_03990 [Rhodospirillaceae bacterium]|nr:hypothetical protein [Rhodospirillaceae bacterium]MDD9996885.1 hypothetical protein [Rhodospirillaceae bacterium]MDE0363038.1 hypothetical protein [Rhodospirillaceae bacterium]
MAVHIENGIEIVVTPGNLMGRKQTGAKEQASVHDRRTRCSANGWFSHFHFTRYCISMALQEPKILQKH